MYKAPSSTTIGVYDLETGDETPPAVFPAYSYPSNQHLSKRASLKEVYIDNVTLNKHLEPTILLGDDKGQASVDGVHVIDLADTNRQTRWVKIMLILIVLIATGAALAITIRAYMEHQDDLKGTARDATSVPLLDESRVDTGQVTNSPTSSIPATSSPTPSNEGDSPSPTSPEEADTPTPASLAPISTAPSSWIAQIATSTPSVWLTGPTWHEETTVTPAPSTHAPLTSAPTNVAAMTTTPTSSPTIKDEHSWWETTGIPTPAPQY